jgi:SAM-dependent methyltransferase
MDDITINNETMRAAQMWSSGGTAYDEVSFAISDALAHAAQRLAPKPGDKILDVATGTGWSARNAARMGAEVTGVDIAAGLLDAARELSRAFNPPIAFLNASAEKLPFADAAYDGIISTFGVMFAADHEKTAGELARVCRPGGRMCLATWVPGGAVAEFFALLGGFSEAPPPEPSPLLWGDPDYLKSLLGSDFSLVSERGWNNAYHENADAIWDWYLRGFGPLKALHDDLDANDRRKLKTKVDAYHNRYKTEAGLCVRREYLVTIATRR